MEGTLTTTTAVPRAQATPIVPLNATLAGAAEVRRLDVAAMHESRSQAHEDMTCR